MLEKVMFANMEFVWFCFIVGSVSILILHSIETYGTPNIVGVWYRKILRIKERINRG